MTSGTRWDSGAGWDREGGRAAGPAGSSSPPPSPGNSGPDSRPRSLAAPPSWAPGTWGRPGGVGRGALAHFASSRDEGRQVRMAFSLVGFGAWGSPGGPELRGGGCSLGHRGFSGPGPGPPRQTEALRKTRGKASTFIPAAFTLSMPGPQRVPLEGAAARQLAKQWKPRFPRPPPLRTEDEGRVNGRLWGLGRAGCLPCGWLLNLTFACKGVECVWEGRTAYPRPLGETALTSRPANLSFQ